MITFSQANRLHSILIKEFGGSDGIRDNENLLSALIRPFQSFEGKELYPTPVDKAAAIIESILQNHPFVDGNKRTGYVLMRMLLLQGNLDIHASQEEKYKFVIAIASGQLNFEQIQEWLKIHVK